MRGDFSRSTFEPTKHYTSVRMQQGRVQLDADWNEQVDILLHLLRGQARDLLGPYGAPAGSAGFAIAMTPAGNDRADLSIAAGRYYIDGVVVENDSDTLFSAQPYWPNADLPEASADGARFIVYLDAWERHLSGHEAPAILEPALNGLDTTTRTQTVWQVKLWPEPAGQAGDEPATDEGLFRAWQAWRAREIMTQAAGRRGKLRPSITPAGYGLPNQLYRVEIHSTGEETTFKWSRDNGSVALAVASLELDETSQILTVTLEKPLAELPVQEGDWMELADASCELHAQPAPLFKVKDVPDRNASATRLTLVPGSALPAQKVQDIQAIGKRLAAAAQANGSQAETIGPRTILRRWDYSEHARGASIGQDGALKVQPDRWLPLENGIAVCFEDAGKLRAGDYWLIPARSEADGYTLLWPIEPAPRATGNGDTPTSGRPATPATEPKRDLVFAALPARQVDHHVAPLAVLARDGTETTVTDVRTLFRPLPVFEAETLSKEKQLQAAVKALQTELTHQAAAAREAVQRLRDEMLREVARTPSVIYPLADASADVEPGQVVALDPATGGIELATRNNAALVAGVAIGPAADWDDESQATRRYRVAQTGRHECLVLGRVEPGDLLTPSDTPGCATAAGLYVQPGTVIGKALQGHHPTDARQYARIAIMVTLR